jgi:hypothetical protein
MKGDTTAQSPSLGDDSLLNLGHFLSAVDELPYRIHPGQLPQFPRPGSAGPWENIFTTYIHIYDELLRMEETASRYGW